MAEAGYLTAMRGESVKYHEFAPRFFNILTRLLSRSLTLK